MTVTKGALAIAVIAGAILFGCLASPDGAPPPPSRGPRASEQVEPSAGPGRPGC